MITAKVKERSSTTLRIGLSELILFKPCLRKKRSRIYWIDLRLTPSQLLKLGKKRKIMLLLLKLSNGWLIATFTLISLEKRTLKDFRRCFAKFVSKLAKK